MPLPAGRVLELGCGVALPSLALRSRGADVLATDYYADALRFAEANAERNRLSPLATALVDWRTPPPALDQFDLLIAADVFYERRNADALAAALPRLLGPAGVALLADPGRIYLREFRSRMLAAGWGTAEVHCAREISDPRTGATSEIRILRISRP